MAYSRTPRVSIYMATWMELGDEPMVIETPLRTFWDSSMMHWFKYVVDFGNLRGQTKARAVKFLILPPRLQGRCP